MPFHTVMAFRMSDDQHIHHGAKQAMRENSMLTLATLEKFIPALKVDNATMPHEIGGKGRGDRKAADFQTTRRMNSTESNDSPAYISSALDRYPY